MSEKPIDFQTVNNLGAKQYPTRWFQANQAAVHAAARLGVVRV